MAVTLPNPPLQQLAAFNAFDWLLLVVLAWSVIVAFARGIIRELFGLAGTVLGLLLAAWNYTSLAVWLSRWITSPTPAQIAAFLLIAVSTMLACTLLGRLVRGTAHTVGLGFLDRLSGAVFGLLRGGLVGVAILAAATAFFPPQPWVRSSRLAPYFLAATREVCFVVPQDLQKRITGGIDSVRHIARR